MPKKEEKTVKEFLQQELNILQEVEGYDHAPESVIVIACKGIGCEEVAFRMSAYGAFDSETLAMLEMAKSDVISRITQGELFQKVQEASIGMPAVAILGSMPIAGGMADDEGD